MSDLLYNQISGAAAAHEASLAESLEVVEDQGSSYLQNPMAETEVETEPEAQPLPAEPEVPQIPEVQPLPEVPPLLEKPEDDSVEELIPAAPEAPEAPEDSGFEPYTIEPDGTIVPEAEGLKNWQLESGNTITQLNDEQKLKLIYGEGVTKRDDFYQFSEIRAAHLGGDTAKVDELASFLATQRVYKDYKTQVDAGENLSDDPTSEPAFHIEVAKERQKIIGELSSDDVGLTHYSNQLPLLYNRALDAFGEAVGANPMVTHKSAKGDRATAQGTIAAGFTAGIGGALTLYPPTSLVGLRMLSGGSLMAAFTVGAAEGAAFDQWFDKQREENPESAGWYTALQMATSISLGMSAEPLLDRQAKKIWKSMMLSPSFAKSQPSRLYNQARVYKNLHSLFRGDVTDPKYNRSRRNAFNMLYKQDLTETTEAQMAAADLRLGLTDGYMLDPERGMEVPSFFSKPPPIVQEGFVGAEVRLKNLLVNGFADGEKGQKGAKRTIMIDKRAVEVGNFLKDLRSKVMEKKLYNILAKDGEGAFTKAVLHQFDRGDVLMDQPEIIEALIASKDIKMLESDYFKVAQKLAAKQVDDYINTVSHSLAGDFAVAEGLSQNRGGFVQHLVAKESQKQADLAQKLMAKRVNPELFPELDPMKFPEVNSIIDDWDAEAFGLIGEDLRYFYDHANQLVQERQKALATNLGRIGINRKGKVIINNRGDSIDLERVAYEADYHPLLAQAAYVHKLFNTKPKLTAHGAISEPTIFNPHQMNDYAGVLAARLRLFHRAKYTNRTTKGIEDELRLAKILGVYDEKQIGGAAEFTVKTYDRNTDLRNKLYDLPIKEREKIAFDYTPDLDTKGGVKQAENQRRIASVAQEEALKYAKGHPGDVPDDLAKALDDMAAVPEPDSVSTIYDQVPEEHHSLLDALEKSLDLEFDPKDIDRYLELIDEKIRVSTDTSEIDFWNELYDRVDQELPLTNTQGRKLLDLGAPSELTVEAVISQLDKAAGITNAMGLRDAKIVRGPSGRGIPTWGTKDYGLIKKELLKTSELSETQIDDFLALRKELIRIKVGIAEAPPTSSATIEARQKTREKLTSWYETEVLQNRPPSEAERRRGVVRDKTLYKASVAGIKQSIDKFKISKPAKDALNELVGNLLTEAAKVKGSTRRSQLREVKKVLTELDVKSAGAGLAGIIGKLKISKEEKDAIFSLITTQPHVLDEVAALVDKMPEGPERKAAQKEVRQVGARARKYGDPVPEALYVAQTGKEFTPHPLAGVIPRASAESRSSLDPEGVAKALQQYTAMIAEEDPNLKYVQLAMQGIYKNIPQEYVDIAQSYNALKGVLATRLQHLTGSSKKEVASIVEHPSIKQILQVDDWITSETANLAGSAHMDNLGKLQLAFVDQLNNTDTLKNATMTMNAVQVKNFQDALFYNQLGMANISKTYETDPAQAVELMRDFYSMKLANAGVSSSRIVDQVGKIDMVMDADGVLRADIPADIRKSLGQEAADTRVEHMIRPSVTTPALTEGLTAEETATTSRIAMNFLKRAEVDLDTAPLTAGMDTDVIGIFQTNPISPDDFVKRLEKTAGTTTTTSWEAAGYHYKYGLKRLGITEPQLKVLSQQRQHLEDQFEKVLAKIGQEIEARPFHRSAQMGAEAKDRMRSRMMDAIIGRRAALLNLAMQETMETGAINPSTLKVLRALDVDISSDIAIVHGVEQAAGNIHPGFVKLAARNAYGPRDALQIYDELARATDLDVSHLGALSEYRNFGSRRQWRQDLLEYGRAVRTEMQSTMGFKTSSTQYNVVPPESMMDLDAATRTFEGATHGATAEP